MTARTDRWRKMRRAVGTLVVLALVYEAADQHFTLTPLVRCHS